MIIVDTETTGLSPEKHSIVSIGALISLIQKINFTKNDKFGMVKK